MKQRLSKLIDVKSIITLMLTLLFCCLSIRGNIPREVNDIYLMIVAFYFGTQAKKKTEDNK